MHSHRHFAKAVSAHLAVAQNLISMEHDKEFAMLEEENKKLRQRLADLGELTPEERENHVSMHENANASIHRHDYSHHSQHSQAHLTSIERATMESLYPDRPSRSNQPWKSAQPGVNQGAAPGVRKERPHKSVGLADVPVEEEAVFDHAFRMETRSYDEQEQAENEESPNRNSLPRKKSKTMNYESKGNKSSRSSRSDKLDQTYVLYSGAPPDYDKKAHSSTSFIFPDETAFQRFVHGDRFEIISAAVILANTVIMAFNMQFDGIGNGYDISFPSYTRPKNQVWPGAKKTFMISAYLFNTLFTIELVMRLAAARWRAIRSGWIWFDTIIVVMGLADLFSQGKGIGINPGMMRVIRLVRLVRLLKIFQAMSSFDSLFLLLKAIHASWNALVWSFLLLLSIELVIGLFLCQLLNDYITDDHLEEKDRREVFKYFGTFSRSMLTMFEITLANWVPSCRVLSEQVSAWFGLFYIVYRCMLCFAVIKVIAAVFITETNRVLASDDELTMMKRKREGILYHTKLTKMFKSIDTNRDGHIDWWELQAILNNEEKASWLSTLGFESNDFEKLFWLIDEGDGVVEIAEFIKKVGRLKGQSKTIDMLTLSKLAHRIDQRLSKLCDQQAFSSSTSEEDQEEAEEDQETETNNSPEKKDGGACDGPAVQTYQDSTGIVVAAL